MSYWKSQQFLSDAKANAQKNGYDPSKLSLATDNTHKLQYLTPDNKIVKFGRLPYKDYLYYKRYEPTIASQKQNTFRKSHGAISKLHNLGKYSANELSINILW